MAAINSEQPVPWTYSIDPGTGRNTAKFGGSLQLIDAISTPGGATGTLTNAPHAGNPQTWLAIKINGVDHFIPAWHA